MTLLCQSSTQVDSFLLFKEGASPPYTRQISKRQDPQYEAEFSFSAVTSDFGGTYRCFGTQSSSPYLLSHSSVPVEIIVSGEMTLTSVRSEGNSRYLTLEALDCDGGEFVLWRGSQKLFASQ